MAYALVTVSGGRGEGGKGWGGRRVKGRGNIDVDTIVIEEGARRNPHLY